MNWLDKYIIQKSDGFLEAKDGSLWVEIDNDTVRLAKGNGVSDGFSPISRDEFISRLIGSEKA